MNMVITPALVLSQAWVSCLYGFSAGARGKEEIKAILFRKACSGFLDLFREYGNFVPLHHAIRSTLKSSWHKPLASNFHMKMAPPSTNGITVGDYKNTPGCTNFITIASLSLYAMSHYYFWETLEDATKETESKKREVPNDVRELLKEKPSSKLFHLSNSCKQHLVKGDFPAKNPDKHTSIEALFGKDEDSFDTEKAKKFAELSYEFALPHDDDENEVKVTLGVFEWIKSLLVENRVEGHTGFWTDLHKDLEACVKGWQPAKHYYPIINAKEKSIHYFFPVFKSSYPNELKNDLKKNRNFPLLGKFGLDAMRRWGQIFGYFGGEAEDFEVPGSNKKRGQQASSGAAPGNATGGAASTGGGGGASASVEAGNAAASKTSTEVAGGGDAGGTKRKRTQTEAGKKVELTHEEFEALLEAHNQVVEYGDDGKITAIKKKRKKAGNEGEEDGEGGGGQKKKGSGDSGPIHFIQTKERKHFDKAYLYAQGKNLGQEHAIRYASLTVARALGVKFVRSLVACGLAMNLNKYPHQDDPNPKVESAVYNILYGQPTTREGGSDYQGFARTTVEKILPPLLWQTHKLAEQLHLQSIRKRKPKGDDSDDSDSEDEDDNDPDVVREGEKVKEKYLSRSESFHWLLRGKEHGELPRKVDVDQEPPQMEDGFIDSSVLMKPEDPVKDDDASDGLLSFCLSGKFPEVKRQSKPTPVKGSNKSKAKPKKNPSKQAQTAPKPSKAWKRSNMYFFFGNDPLYEPIREALKSSDVAKYLGVSRGNISPFVLMHRAGSLGDVIMLEENTTRIGPNPDQWQKILSTDPAKKSIRSTYYNNKDLEFPYKDIRLECCTMSGNLGAFDG